MAEALYRKYRPQVFGDVVGQNHVEQTLKNAIDQDKVSHAYLFAGPRGTGKTTTARLLAKALLCQRGKGVPTSDPDGTCADCELIANGTHPDVYELDAASRTGVDSVREEIIGRVQYAPTRGRYKVYIIDEVHMLSTAAFNALLKTLEEPPSHVVFVLATTDPQKVPETILSRCQRFDFHRIGTDAMVARLGAVCAAENVEFEGEALELVAHRAEGGMRNALTILEQLIAFGEGQVSLVAAERMLGRIDKNDMASIVYAVGTHDAAACFRWVAAYIETGADLAQFARDMAVHVRNLYVMSLAGADAALEISEAERTQMVHELELFGSDRLARLLVVLGDVLAELKTSTNQRLTFEIALTRMVRPDSDITLASLAERIETLERGRVCGAAVSDGEEGATASVALEETKRVDKEAASEMQTVMDKPKSVPPTKKVETSSAQPAVSEQPSEQAPALDVQTPAASPQNSGVNLQNPAAVQRLWQSASTALKRNKAAYGVLFMNTKAFFDPERESLVIEFPPEKAFAFSAVQKPDVQALLAEALQQAAGAPVPFVCVLQNATAGAKAPDPVPVVASVKPVVPAATSGAFVPPEFASGSHDASAASESNAAVENNAASTSNAASESNATSESNAAPTNKTAPEGNAAPASNAAPTGKTGSISNDVSDTTSAPRAQSDDELKENISAVFGDGVVFSSE